MSVSAFAAAQAAVGAQSASGRSPEPTPIEEVFDERVSLKTLFLLYLRGFAYSLIVFMLFLLVFLISLVLSIMGGNGAASALGGDFFGFGLFLSVIVYFAVILFTKVSDPISEWKTLVEDKAPAAQGAYAAIAWALRSRQIPVTANAQQVRSDILPGSTNCRLVIRDNYYYAYVSVFEYGTSLYIGWSMWRRRMGIRLIFTFYKDMLAEWVNRGDLLRQMLRTERARAMREAVHSAAREGAQAAIMGTQLTIASVFGGMLPVEDLDRPDPVASAPIAPTPTAPPPAPAPAAPQTFSQPPLDVVPPQMAPFASADQGPSPDDFS